MRFIAWLVGERHLLFRGIPRLAADLARGCRMLHAETLVREEGDKERC